MNHPARCTCEHCFKAVTDRLSGLIGVRPSYQQYIESDEWKRRSTEAKKRAGYRCQVCNAKGNDRTLHAHHRTYDRLGNEDAGDITVLCDDCHKLFSENGKLRH